MHRIWYKPASFGASGISMSSPYTQQVLKVIVAQVCQTIGWNSIQTTPLELLGDILHKYLQEVSQQTHRYSELCTYTFSIHMWACSSVCLFVSYE